MPEIVTEGFGMAFILPYLVLLLVGVVATAVLVLFARRPVWNVAVFRALLVLPLLDWMVSLLKLHDVGHDIDPARVGSALLFAAASGAVALLVAAVAMALARRLPLLAAVLPLVPAAAFPPALCALLQRWIRPPDEPGEVATALADCIDWEWPLGVCATAILLLYAWRGVRERNGRFNVFGRPRVPS